MDDDLIREGIEKLKMDSSIQTETIKENFKKLMKSAYDKGFIDGIASHKTNKEKKE